mmetsp:Transcript_23335/g.20722  ORF Transcript_23335/g.20722 Transcript_23335/m.20722 type:complete len:108 (-) Transcript_23335:27-350(-)
MKMNLLKDDGKGKQNDKKFVDSRDSDSDHKRRKHQKHKKDRKRRRDSYDRSYEKDKYDRRDRKRSRDRKSRSRSPSAEKAKPKATESIEYWNDLRAKMNMRKLQDNK